MWTIVRSSDKASRASVPVVRAGSTGRRCCEIGSTSARPLPGPRCCIWSRPQARLLDWRTRRWPVGGGARSDNYARCADRHPRRRPSTLFAGTKGPARRGRPPNQTCPARLLGVTMPKGAHVSCADGLSTAVERAQTKRAERKQNHLSAPQRWKEPVHTQEQIDRFI